MFQLEEECHRIGELISTKYVKTGDQLEDIFKKVINAAWVGYLCNKLGTYAPAWGRVIEKKVVL